ncbi:nuclear transport factor 2 family protein [Nocardia crassostreae]|uniref:nuclear transport factor 2 family protein n=1 Tax=Nocardia crassostreae TaxID=53428 RepID=UPI0008379CA1|nr:nuclear transport factor 2 family protein [Nocardia crassostreae]
MTETTARQAAAEKEILAAHENWLAAIVANDAVRIAEFVTADWVMVSERGVAPGTQFLDLVAAGELTHSAMDRVGEPRIRVYGESAVLTARIVNTAHYQGNRFDADEWTTDLYLYRDGRWLCALTQLTNVAPA